MRLIAGKLAQPRWDTAPIERLRVGYLTGYDLNDATPNAVLDRNLRGWLTADDKRWSPPDKAAIEALTPAAFRAFWEPRLASGPIEVQLFGDFKREAALGFAVPGQIETSSPRTTSPSPARAASCCRSARPSSTALWCARPDRSPAMSTAVRIRDSRWRSNWTNT